MNILLLPDSGRFTFTKLSSPISGLYTYIITELKDFKLKALSQIAHTLLFSTGRFRV
jgi:hypothetical protein